MSTVAFEIPAGAKPRPCKGADCDALIYWVKTVSGRRMPVNADGTSHWMTCPNAQRFREGEGSRLRQRELFEDG